jgi:hypothetical protein
MNILLLIIVIIFLIGLFFLIFFKKIRINLFGKIMGFFNKEKLSSSIIAKDLIGKGDKKNTYLEDSKKESDLKEKKTSENREAKKEEKIAEEVNRKEVKKEIKRAEMKHIVKKNKKENTKPEVSLNLISNGNNKKEGILHEKKLTNEEKIQYLMDRIDDKNILNIMEYLKERNFSLENISFSSDKTEDLMTLLKNHILNLLKNRYETLKSQITELRKKGDDLSSVSLELMSVPLKIKIFQASFDKSDFIKVVGILDNVESEVKKIADSKKSSIDSK